MKQCCYQEKDCEEPIKDVAPVGQVPSEAKGEDLHTHFKQVKEDEAEVDNLQGAAEEAWRRQGDAHSVIMPKAE